MSLGLSFLIKKIALSFNIVDLPEGDRKIHQKAIPLLGGVAIFITFFSFLFVFSRHFLSGNLEFRHLMGFFVGALIIMIGGVLDDKYNLKPSTQIIFPILAVLAVVIGGVEIEKITNPLGGFIYLKELLVIGPILIGAWLLGMMYTTKLLDGLDGLVTGIGAVGGFIIFLFTLTSQYFQPDIAFAAILLSGAALGFLVLNFNPAKIFLGEGGSLLFGYILGVLAIISGGKIAIALLIMGVPILDVAWTILRRLIKGKNPFRSADKKHLHYRLLDLGLSQKQTVLIFYFLSFVFGSSALFLQSRGKFLALGILVLIMAIIIVSFWLLERKIKKPSLLLHICCAPCGTYISRELLLPKFKLTWYFYNSNILSEEEFNKRLLYVRMMAEKYKINLIVEPYNHADWLQKVSGRKADLERGARCQICYLDRLKKTAELAQENNFDYFSTTLLVSPYKDTDSIKKISQDLSTQFGIKFLDADFQLNDGYLKSQELAKEFGFYRQKFCACEYSLKQKKYEKI